ncbi:MAG: hypothetical protein SFV24_18595 [Gemmatimonadales bacterium]|nr:hypothetical protein [Gemmatimonadales bacterium]
MSSGDTVAIIRPQDAAADTRDVAIVAEEDGSWVPRRQTSQLVWRDTVGLLEEHGYWLAVGRVSDIEVGVIHEGDPGWIELGREFRLRQRAPVVWARGPDERLPYSAEVALGLQSTLLSAGQRVTATVTPNGPQDSLLAVPAAALVHLPPGWALFAPVGPDTYEIRWVSTGGPAVETVFVRGDVAPRTEIVAGGLRLLVDAVRESLALYAADCRRNERRPR